MIRYFLSAIMLLLLIPSCQNANQPAKAILINPAYKPDDPLLHKTIVMEDSIFFTAYNNCSTQFEKYAAYYSDSIEFFHDQGGLMTSKSLILDGTKKFICDKVTRELIPGTIEVYPIKNFGAIEFGYHQFRNNQEPGAKPHPSRFVIIWQQRANDWKIRKVVSLH